MAIEKMTSLGLICTLAAALAPEAMAITLRNGRSYPAIYLPGVLFAWRSGVANQG
jgi:hypothetical protein